MKLCWNITNKCNANCEHCFRDRNKQEISLENNLIILNKICDFVDEISFSGGEVLLYNDFIDLLRNTYNKKIKCSITTNSLLLTFENLKEIMKYINRITFSLDYLFDDDNEKYGRGKNYAEHLKRAISWVKQINSNFPIKINTVLTKRNLSIIPQLYQFIKNNGVQTWQLMRYCNFRQANSELEITDEDFIQIKKKYETNDINLLIKDTPEIENQYVISPNGDLSVGRNDEDIVILPCLQNQDKNLIKESLLNDSNINFNALNINLNLYKTFYYVAKMGSINAASNLLFISQPAISKSIKKIEQELNVKLFDRTINGVILTKTGEELYARVETAYNEIITAERIIKDNQSFSKGRLIIGAPSHIASFLVFEKVKEFKNKYPQVNISIISRSTKELLEMLNSHEIDFIVDALPSNFEDHNLTIKKILSAEHCFFCNYSNSNRYNGLTNIVELNKNPLILPVDHSSHRKNLNILFSQQGVKLNNTLSLETSEMIVDAVKQNLGIGYILYDYIKSDIEKKLLYKIDLDIALPKIDICLMYNSRYLTFVPKYFIENYLQCND
ncbi:MAG: LysR substrate-binding domain-containing protein [Christensenellales bacterium]